VKSSGQGLSLSYLVMAHNKRFSKLGGKQLASTTVSAPLCTSDWINLAMMPSSPLCCHTWFSEWNYVIYFAGYQAL